MFVKSTSVAVFFPFSALAYSATCSNYHTANHLLRPICRGPPDVYIVEPTNGKGLGVFAMRDLDIGDIVMRESPVIRISRSKLTKGSENPMAAVAKLVYDEFKMLSPSAQEQVLALSYYANGTVNTQSETLGTIFRTNAYNTGDKFSLFPRIARINHSFDSQLLLDPPKTKAEVEHARKSAEVSVQLAQLVQAEGLADYYARAYRIVALSFAKLENWQSATDWANKAYKLRHMEDPESPYTMEMHELTSTYISKWQTQLTGRS
ncbi:hypothetical protein GGP41_001944 [Bipolaris sorokiniana]|uniref:SET domain-containing protein n=1 Tax=Cochliobolus sativus TaxID=45130 RepID=A0A8H6DZJ7_COCSA|nr:hypothetical protein GGP41_001944 [Bipolaris sorokiniana]